MPVLNVGAPAPAEPFQHQVSSFVQDSLSLTVPAGKRLVIEFYSGAAGTRVPCAMAAMVIETNVSADSMQHKLLAVPVVLGQESEFNQVHHQSTGAPLRGSGDGGPVRGEVRARSVQQTSRAWPRVI